MPQITIDGTEYDTDQFSDEAKANLASLQFVKSELNRLQAQTAVYKTSEVAYMNALKQTIS
tara:strand:+ start:683 stop:865 length:183 start_codon:yes stop_codon:yes gene_type:complete